MVNRVFPYGSCFRAVRLGTGRTVIDHINKKICGGGGAVFVRFLISRYEIAATPPARKPGPLMEAVLRHPREQDAFAQLDSSWTRRSTMPAWVSLEAVKAGECEFATRGGAPGIMDAFSYTVIVGENRRPIVLRTGGFAGVYQIFEANEPARRPAPVALPLSRQTC